MPIIVIVIIIVVGIVGFGCILKSGTFGVLGWSCRDAGQHGANPGHPGESGTGDNPNHKGPQRTAQVCKRAKNHKGLLIRRKLPQNVALLCRFLL